MTGIERSADQDWKTLEVPTKGSPWPKPVLACACRYCSPAPTSWSS